MLVMCKATFWIRKRLQYMSLEFFLSILMSFIFFHFTANAF